MPLLILVDDVSSQLGSSWLPLWVGVITATSALLGVGITGLLTYRLKKMELTSSISEEKRRRRIERLEELHRGLLAMISLSAGFIADHSDFRQRGSTSSTEISAIMAKINTHFAELWSLQRIYFPDGDGNMNDIYGQLSVLTKTGVAYLANAGYTLEVFVKPHEQLLDKCLDLREAVKVEIQKIVL
jgi:hypothetical protein